MSIADKDTQSAQELVPVGDVLNRLGHEVSILADAVGDLQNLVGNLVVAGAFGSSQSLYELQSLDKLCQSLEAISEFMKGISRQSSGDWRIDAVEASRSVKLADVSGRLSGSQAEEPADGRCEPGDYDDFDIWALTG